MARERLRKEAGHPVAGLALLERGARLGAAWLGHRTARGEAAARGQVDRTRRIAPQPDARSTVAPVAVQGGHGREQRPRAGGVDPVSWTPDPLGRRYPLCQDKTAEWFDWLCHDKGYGRRLLERSWDTAPMPVGFGTLGEYPNVTAAMERRGWAETRIRKVHGENWLRVLGEVWGS